MPAMRDKRTGRFAKPQVGDRIDTFPRALDKLVETLNNRNKRTLRGGDVDVDAMIRSDKARAKREQKGKE